MVPKTGMELAFWVFVILILLFLFWAVVIFWRSYRDPRWRVFDYNSRQASEGDIYNVAEVPAVRAVRLAGRRRLRFAFTPDIPAASWKVFAGEDRRLIFEGTHPEIPFSDEPVTETYLLEPQGVSLNREIAIRISFYPKERYEVSGLSWPDNYYTPDASVPFSLKRPWSADAWVGLPEDDPDLVEARRILGDAVDMQAPALDRLAQVFGFVMGKIHSSGGTPSDEMQDASPLKTYTMLTEGTGKGWCENRALVFYLFANAAGVKTRLVDIAGKFGPLKLTGHYFCESWIPERTAWCFVDPQSNVAYLTGADGRLFNTLDLKRLIDLSATEGCRALCYDDATGDLAEDDARDFFERAGGYFRGDIVLAYKFGYPRNPSYSRLRHFLFYPTLLYAPFALPNLYLIKQICLWGLAICAAISVVLGIARLV